MSNKDKHPSKESEDRKSDRDKKPKPATGKDRPLRDGAIAPKPVDQSLCESCFDVLAQTGIVKETIFCTCADSSDSNTRELCHVHSKARTAKASAKPKEDKVKTKEDHVHTKDCHDHKDKKDGSSASKQKSPAKEAKPVKPSPTADKSSTPKEGKEKQNSKEEKKPTKK